MGFFPSLLSSFFPLSSSYFLCSHPPKKEKKNPLHILVRSFALPHFAEMTHLDLVGLKEERSTLRAFGNRSTAALKRTLSVLCSTVSIHSYLVISQLFSLSLVILCHTLSTAVQSGCFYSKRSSEVSEEQEGTVNKRHSCVL